MKRFIILLLILPFAIISQAQKKVAVMDPTIEEGSKVTVYVSLSEEGIVVPNVVSMTEAEATARLEQDGFKVEKLSEKNDTVELEPYKIIK